MKIKKVIRALVAIILLSILALIFLDMTDVVVLSKYQRSGMYLTEAIALFFVYFDNKNQKK